MGKLVNVTFRQLLDRLNETPVIGYHMETTNNGSRVPRQGRWQTPDQRVEFHPDDVAEWGVYDGYKMRSLVVRLRDGSLLGVPVTRDGQQVQARDNHRTVVKILGGIHVNRGGIRWVPEGHDWTVCREIQ